MLGTETQLVPLYIGMKDDLVELPSIPSVNLIGRTSLPEMIRLLRQAHFYIGMDSGPLHCASACGIPTIELSAFPQLGSPLNPQSPARFQPANPPTLVLQPLGSVGHELSFQGLEPETIAHQSLEFLRSLKVI